MPKKFSGQAWHWAKNGCSHRPAGGQRRARERLDWTAHRAVATDSGVKENFGRRPLRLGRVLTRGPIYFVTFCTHQRRPFLARDEVHAAFVFLPSIPSATSTSASARYVIMPDHVYSTWRRGF